MGAKGFTDEYLKTRSATFGELTKNLLAQDAKSAYKQAAIIMLRNAFADLELCGGEKELDTKSNCSIPVVSNSVVCKIKMRPENCYYRDITMECKGCRNNANNCC